MPTVREAHPSDHAGVLTIYNHYVVADHATFDVTPFTLEQRGPWFGQFGSDERHRLVVVTHDQEVAAYAASTPFRPKPAYGSTVETTVYVAPAWVGQGFGRLAMERLVELLDGAGVRLAVAAIALPNEASERLHRSLGYEPVGVMHEVGRKFDRWIDIRWFERRSG